MRFWDSSALVPLVVEQSESRQADVWFAEDGDLAIWTLTETEILSALRRLEREGALDQAECDGSERRVSELVASCYILIDVEGVKAQARRLLRLHPLRAADALQLGAAKAWAGNARFDRTLHTFDKRLASAARREGFVVP